MLLGNRSKTGARSGRAWHLPGDKGACGFYPDGNQEPAEDFLSFFRIFIDTQRNSHIVSIHVNEFLQEVPPGNRHPKPNIEHFSLPRGTPQAPSSHYVQHPLRSSCLPAPVLNLRKAELHNMNSVVSVTVVETR